MSKICKLKPVKRAPSIDTLLDDYSVLRSVQTDTHCIALYKNGSLLIYQTEQQGEPMPWVEQVLLDKTLVAALKAFLAQEEGQSA